MPRARPRLGLAVLAVLLVWAAADNGHAQRTTTAAISGRVVDGASNVPVASAIVTLATGPSEFIGLPKEQVVDRQATDSSGRFLFTGVAPRSSFYLRASKPGYVDSLLEHEGRPTAPRHIALIEGQWLSDATIRLWRPNALSGTIADEAGEALPGVASFLEQLAAFAVPVIVRAGETTRQDLQIAGGR
jgi:hypothetical protein